MAVRIHLRTDYGLFLLPSHSDWPYARYNRSRDTDHSPSSRNHTKETKKIPTGHRRIKGNKKIPTLHRPLTTQTPFLTSGTPLSPSPWSTISSAILLLTSHHSIGPRNRPLSCTRWRRITALAVPSNTSAARSRRGVYGASIRGHESLRYTCQASDYNAEGCAIGKAD